MSDPSIAGILNLDKPAGWTSHDVVARVRRLTSIRQVGHTGTLDPMATGVLIVCIGWATRLIEYMMGQPKTYLAEITLGASTDTYDATGTTTESLQVPDLTAEQLDTALGQFRGEIWQNPPAYSALKRDGVALYKRARRGEKVEVESRKATIHELMLLKWKAPVLAVRVSCSAGTYVRSIAHDLGQALGCGAHLSALRRTAAGQFKIEDSLPLDNLEAAATGNEWRKLLLPPDLAVAEMEAISFSEHDAVRLTYGQSIPASQSFSDRLARAYDPEGRLLAIVSLDQEQQLWRPSKVFVQPASLQP